MRSTRFLSEGAAALVVLIACSGAQAQRQPPLAAAAAQAQGGHFDQAAATLEAAIRGNPKAGEKSYLLLSECYSQLGDPAKAVNTLRAGLRIYPAAAVLEPAELAAASR